MTALYATRAATTLKNVVLFLAAPFVALAYLIVFPFVGLALLAWMGARAAAKVTAVRTVAVGIAAPFIALACVVAGPFVGLGMLAWIGGKALTKTAEAPAYPAYEAPALALAA